MKQILKELYELHPELHQKEDELTKIINHMVENKPTPPTFENFKKTLKNKLLSEINVYNTEKIETKNKFFRYFWQILTIGAFASFLVTFGLFSLLENNGTLIQSPLSDSVKQADIQTLQILSNSGAEIHKEESMAISGDHTESPNTPELQQSKTKSTVLKIKPESSAEGGITQTNTINPQESLVKDIIKVPAKKDAYIAYVGDNLIINPSGSLTETNNLMSDDLGVSSYDDSSNVEGTNDIAHKQAPSLMMTEPPVVQGNPKSQITFQEIVSRAQAEASKLIDPSEYSSYTLTTPYVSYISKEDTAGNKNITLVEVYIFPLNRIDGKVSKIQEVSVVLSE